MNAGSWQFLMIKAKKNHFVDEVCANAGCRLELEDKISRFVESKLLYVSEYL